MELSTSVEDGTLETSKRGAKSTGVGYEKEKVAYRHRETPGETELAQCHQRYSFP